MKYFFFVLAASLLIFSCTKENKDEANTFVYEQTSCSDPWVNSSSDSITIQNVYHYLDSIQVAGPALHVWIKNEGSGVICQACNCKTGKKIYLSLFFPKNVEDELVAAGFKRVE